MEIEEIQRDYYGLLMKIARKILINQCDAEDAIQDLIIKLPKKIEKYQPQEDVKFSSWLGRVTGNYCIDIIRKNKIRKEKGISSSVLDIENLSGDSDLFEDVSHSNLFANYKRLFNVLLPRQRELLLLVCNGLTYKEIEDELGESEVYVKHHLHNARKIMRNAYKPKQKRVFIEERI